MLMELKTYTKNLNRKWYILSLGIKHLIECHCTLRLYTSDNEQIYHKMPVYSKICQKTNNVLEKIVKCNNCNTLHRVYDICKSEIFDPGKDNSFMLNEIDDIDLEIPEKVSKILKKYSLLKGKSSKIKGSSLISFKSISLSFENLWFALTKTCGGTLISGMKDIFFGRLKLYVTAKSILPLIM